jgi:hypothetical protein
MSSPQCGDHDLDDADGSAKVGIEAPRRRPCAAIDMLNATLAYGRSASMSSHSVSSVLLQH